MSTHGSFEAIPVPPDGYVPGEFVSYRQPDAIRAAALANAVDLVAQRWEGATLDVLGQDVLDLARTFEAYLTGEEAHDAT